MTGGRKVILLIDDELPIRRFLRVSLDEEGFEVVEATSGREALDAAASRKPDIILLDLGLPDMDGLDVLKRLREWSPAPVVILSARGSESDKIAGLDGGADDYLTKPFGVEELLARIRVALRHAQRVGKEPDPVYEHQDLKIDLAARRVWVGKKEVRLSPLQYSLLTVLVRNAGRVVNQAQLLKQVWGPESEATPESLRLLVHEVRHRIERAPVQPRHLKTEPGIGYRIEAPDRDA